MLCVGGVLKGVLHIAVHPLDEVERGRPRIHLCRIDARTALLRYLCVVGRVRETFVQAVRQSREIAEIVPSPRT